MITNMPATFIYYDNTGTSGRTVSFFKDHRTNKYTVTIEGMPSLKSSHPSKQKMLATFTGYYNLAFKDWGASKIRPGSQLSQEECEEIALQVPPDSVEC